MILTEQQHKEFEETVRPVMKWLNTNCHPHCSIIMDSTNAELVEGLATAISKVTGGQFEAVVSKILAGYDAYLADSKDFDSRAEARAYVEAKQADGKITDHIRFYSMEMSSKYMLIVYEDENDNQYWANDGLAPNKIKKVGTARDNLIYMVIEH